MNEKDIIKQIRDYLKTLEGCFSFKMHGGQFGAAGIPDLIICYKGRFIALEVKAEKGRTTILQEATLRRIRAAGGIAEVVRSVSDAQAILLKI